MSRIEKILLTSHNCQSNREHTIARLIRGVGLEGEGSSRSDKEHPLLVIPREGLSETLECGLHGPQTGLPVHLLTSNADFRAYGPGRRLRFGATAVCQVLQLGCAVSEIADKDEEPSPISMEGVYLRVCRSGTIQKGDLIRTDPELDCLRYAVVTLSDRGSRGESEDLSGPLISELLRKAFSTFRVDYRLLPDDEIGLASHLRSLVEEGLVDLILTTGGTGLAPRDRTPEATRQVIHREIPGIAEAIRAKGLEKTPFAMLSRALAGVCKDSLIINLSGSPRAVREQLEVVIPILSHALETINGVKVSCARP